MRKKIKLLLIICCVVLISGNLKAQREIQFSYDNSGNMTNRIIYFPAAQATIMNPSDITDQNVGEKSNTSNVNNNEVFSDQLGSQEIKIYPNPTTGKLTVDIPAYKANSNDQIDIVDMQGILIQSLKNLGANNIIFLNSCAPGTYIMLIYISGETSQWKIIKQ